MNHDDNTPNYSEDEDSLSQILRQNASNLRQYLENKCYCNTQWSRELIFRVAMEQETFTDMDITKFIRDLQYKETYTT